MNLFRFIMFATFVVALSSTSSTTIAADETQATGQAPARRVVAYYFHRTNRCPTCKKISALTEEAINAGYAEQLKDKTISLYMIDFQAEKNEQYVKYYKLTGPTLVMADVRDGKVTQWKKLPKVWSLIFDKEKFLRYVQKEARDYLEAS